MGAITRSRVGCVSHHSLSALLDAHPQLARVFWQATLIDAAISREWILGLGRRDASARLAHLLCELHARYEVVGLANEGSFEFNVTQAELGDALGLSTVHVNRTVRALRAQGLIGQAGPTLKILRARALARGLRLRPGLPAS